MMPEIGNNHCHPRRTLVNTCDTASVILPWICTIASFAAASQHYSHVELHCPTSVWDMIIKSACVYHDQYRVSIYRPAN